MGSLYRPRDTRVGSRVMRLGGKWSAVSGDWDLVSENVKHLALWGDEDVLATEEART